MGALLLAILCSSSIALLFKVSETRGLNRLAVTATNYAAGVVVALALVLRDAMTRDGWPQALPTAWALAIGAVTGVFFVGGFLLYQEAVKRHGASLAGAFAKLGIIVAVALSLVVWGGGGRIGEALAIVLGVAAVVVANWPRGREWKKALRLVLVALALVSGTAEYMHSVFEREDVANHLPVFLLGAFSTGLLVSVWLLRRSRKKTQARDIALGIAVGLPNLGSSAFLVTALTTLPAGVAYAGFGAGTVLVIAGAAWLFFNEKPDLAARIAMGLTVAALVVMQLPF
jgi:multidrug transporter EmrE-like cation transporter